MFYLITKKCFKCGQLKIINDFYRHPGMADGFLGKCKVCVNKYRKEYYKKHIKHIKIYNQTKQGKISHKKSNVKWRINNPEKIKAQNIINQALYKKKLLKEPCRECGAKEKVEGHHEDYNFPLDVVWLCQQHHLNLHKIIKGKKGSI